MNVKSFLPGGAALLFTLALAGTAARADVKIVSEVDMGAVPFPVPAAAPAAGAGNGKPLVTTSYYKGDRSRVESGGSVIIVTGKADGGKTFVLDPVARTYYVQATSGGAGNAAALSEDSPFLSSVRIDGDLKVDSSSSVTKNIAGRVAKLYRLTGNFKIMLGGGDNGGAGFPLANVTLNGEQWTTETLTVPTLGAAVPGASTFLNAMPPLLAKSDAKLKTQMAAIKGYPLLSAVSVTVTMPKDSPFAEMAAGAFPTKPITARTEVKQLSEDPLPDDLFAVPAGYKQVEPPAAPALPGLGTPPSSPGI
jgi:hypothetical protein